MHGDDQEHQQPCLALVQGFDKLHLAPSARDVSRLVAVLRLHENSFAYDIVCLLVLGLVDVSTLQQRLRGVMRLGEWTGTLWPTGALNEDGNGKIERKKSASSQ